MLISLAVYNCFFTQRQQFNVYRVVTFSKDKHGNRIPDPGPWLATENQADFWADFLQSVGYRVKVEKLSGDLTGNHTY